MGATGKGVSDKPWNGAASRFTDEQYRRAAAACDPLGDSTVKQTCFLPHHEPDGTTNRNGVHAAAARFSQLKGHTPEATARAKAHLRSHYSELDEDVPDVLAAAPNPYDRGGVLPVGYSLIPIAAAPAPAAPEPSRVTQANAAAHMAAAHGFITGQHSHAHPAYGSQGGDGSHEHMHSHDGDNNHRHDHPMEASQPAGVLSFIAAGSESDDHPFAMLGARWGILQHHERWTILRADGAPWEAQPAGEGALNAAGEIAWNPAPGYESYAEAVAAIGQQLAEEPPRPVLATTWRADSAFEDRSTGDGRRIGKGAIEYRSTPLPLMLQTTTQGGHMGAVLAGSIEQTGKLGDTAITTGSYDDSEAGRQAEQIVAARGRFGVSIDVAEAEGSFECVERDEDGLCTDGEMVFSLIRIMGQTMTPFPAFEDAYIENVPVGQEAVAASALVSAECVDCGDGPFEQLVVPGPEPGRLDPLTLVAAGGPARPPRAWFDDPQFGPNDGRTVRQPDGQWLCPLTVLPSGQVFGHFAGWETCHTGYAAACQRPPRSQSGYAAFMLRPLQTAEGDIVHVGHISMGCGHIADDGRVPIEVVRAHYDGGPGARLMARVRCGDDAYGGWFAGALVDGLSAADVRTFQSLSVSGHWRKVWAGKGLDLLAIVAGVPVPGFPVSAMAAAGYDLSPLEGGGPIGDTQVAFEDGSPVALVAAGVVRQPWPWERMLAALDARVEGLERRLRAAERVTAPLRPMAAESLVASLVPAAANGHAEPEPPPED